MAELTPFGKALRKLRIDKGMRIFDLAERLGRSTAMISAIETGRKPIPDNFISSLVRELGISAEEQKELRSAKDRTAKEVRVAHLAPDQRELLAAFARRPDDVPHDLFEQVRKALLKSVAGEIPFKRRRRGILVRARSRAEIEELTKKIRSVFDLADTQMLPIINILEFILPKIDPKFSLDILDEEEMDGDEGRVPPGHNTIILRRDVYDAACRDEGRTRFTATHELAHYLMHHEVTFARAASDEDPIYRDAEWQADTFAGFLMIPRHLAQDFDCPVAAAKAFGTSQHAASVMLTKYGQQAA